MASPVRQRIRRFIEERLLSFDNPRSLGQAMLGERSDLHRSRVGDYRIICKIEDHRLVVIVVTIGHRREIFR